MTNLTVEQLQKWYRKQLKKSSKDFLKQAEKSYKIVQASLNDIEEIVSEFQEEEQDELDTATSVRFANKVKEIADDFYVEKEITYESTELLQTEIQRFIQELWEAGRRWIKRMDKKYKALVKSLDSVLKELTREMNRIAKLLYEYSWVKDLERIGGRIDTLQELTFSKEIFEEQIGTVRQKIAKAHEDYEKARKAYADFTETSNVAELLNLDDQADHVSKILSMKLNPLKKQVKKFLQHDTGVRISPEGQKALIEYFENPYTAIVEDANGYPALMAGLHGLREAIEKDSLSLKDRLARRAIEEIDSIGGGSLQEYQTQAKDIEEKRRLYAGSDVYSKSEELQLSMEEAKKNLEYHRNDLLRIRDDIDRQIEKVEEFKTRIEGEIAKAFNEKVSIQVEVSLEPLLDLCTVA